MRNHNHVYQALTFLPRWIYLMNIFRHSSAPAALFKAATMMNETPTTFQSYDSSTMTKHRSGILTRAHAALSSLSKPVDNWGVSDVPILSSQITPRRSRSRQYSDSNKSVTMSPLKPTRSRAPGNRSRVLSMRPLSIASVSTFGAWMLDQICADDEADSDHNEYDTETETQSISKLSVPASYSEAQHETPVQHKYVYPDYPSVNLNGSLFRDLGTGTHPLRMHPPSSSPSLRDQATAMRKQDAPRLSQTSSCLYVPTTPLLDDGASKASQDTISTRRSRPTLTELDINVANNNVQTNDEKPINERQEINDDMQKILVSAPEDVSVPCDVGYVEAMRLWYEEKENAALEDQARGRRNARKIGIGGCAMSSASACQRL
ncbi:hypothetical protein BU25DRAFT_420087 [Macroventuria anomochaeta]|uniref:Uncharacterized protein n=1 Tax=Macroventuria anomochaeta TaxID=301207 RepID=A0ACB6S4L0_9PLEO|nr:uncharacterized protein BU25DRAFT_420087 [Macroventuria anomochaeta]KAF2629195.1 hypothetical protein BU25DRAFT_420087 [Macroventuria anomochaeta]